MTLRGGLGGEAPQLWLLLLLASISGSLWASVAARTGESYAKVNHKRGR